MKNDASYAQKFLESYSIGMKLRALRTRKRFTLSRLASETGLSTALLSKLETDRMIPTLPTLSIICHVYGVGLSHFFQEPAHHTLSITRKAHLQAVGRSRESIKVTPLHAAPHDPSLVAQVVDLSPEGASCNPAIGGKTISLIYVLDGKLAMEAGGTQELLETGDCAFIESEVAMDWSAAAKAPCRILVVSPAPLPAQ